jgi:hypothetical protein
MGKREGFVRYLSPDVTLMPQDRVGTPSGNPTSLVAYGFEDGSVPPKYAVGYVLPCDEEVSDARDVAVAGPFSIHDYRLIMDQACNKGVGESVILARCAADDGCWKAYLQTNVPRQITTERIISALVNMVLDKD